MNELIKELAEKSGATHKQSLGVYQFYSGELEEFAKLIAEHEREECAKICDEHQGYMTGICALKIRGK